MARQKNKWAFTIQSEDDDASHADYFDQVVRDKSIPNKSEYANDEANIKNDRSKSHNKSRIDN